MAERYRGAVVVALLNGDILYPEEGDPWSWNSVKRSGRLAEDRDDHHRSRLFADHMPIAVLAQSDMIPKRPGRSTTG